MNIACSFNKAYLQHFMVMVKSLTYNTKAKDINIHILHSDLDEKEISIISDEFGSHNFYFYRIDDSLIKTFPLGLQHFSKETYSRLMLGEVLHEWVEKVIYLDCDLVVRKDIQLLYTKDLQPFHVGAVLDLYDKAVDHLTELNSFFDYFNAGVLLINLKAFRIFNYNEKFMTFALNNLSQLIYADQDVLNSVIKGQWARLPIEWNVTSNVFNFKEKNIEYLGEIAIEKAINNPHIIHYTTHNKPWQLLTDIPYKIEYLKYFDLLNYKFEIFPERRFVDNKLIIFGAGQLGMDVYNYLDKCEVKPKEFWDNDSKKWGSKLYNIEITQPCSKKHDEIILIASQYHKEISNQLNEMGFVENVDYFLNISDLTKYLNSKLIDCKGGENLCLR